MTIQKDVFIEYMTKFEPEIKKVLNRACEEVLQKFRNQIFAVIERTQQEKTGLPPKETSSESDDVIDAKEAAEILRCSTRNVYLMVKQYGLPVIRVGKRTIRFSRNAILEWIDAQSGNKCANQQ